MDSIGKRWAANVAGAESGNMPAPKKEERTKTTAVMEPQKKANPARQQYKQNLLNSISGQGGQQQAGQNQAMAAMAGGV